MGFNLIMVQGMIQKDEQGVFIQAKHARIPLNYNYKGYDEHVLLNGFFQGTGKRLKVKPNHVVKLEGEAQTVTNNVVIQGIVKSVEETPDRNIAYVSTLHGTIPVLTALSVCDGDVVLVSGFFTEKNGLLTISAKYLSCVADVEGTGFLQIFIPEVMQK